MVDTKSIAMHAVLFCCYMGATTFWAIWNHASITLLTTSFAELVQNGGLTQGYSNWIKSYYQCLLQFSWANLLVQCFTIWIFYTLTRPEKKHDEAPRETYISDNSDNEIERLTVLEHDMKHIQTFNRNSDLGRSSSMETANLDETTNYEDHSMIEGKDNNRESLISSNNQSVHDGSPRAKSDVDIIIKEKKAVELSKTKLKHRIFAQFIQDDQVPDISPSNNTAETRLDTAGFAETDDVEDGDDIRSRGDSLNISQNQNK